MPTCLGQHRGHLLLGQALHQLPQLIPLSAHLLERISLAGHMTPAVCDTQLGSRRPQHGACDHGPPALTYWRRTLTTNTHRGTRRRHPGTNGTLDVGLPAEPDLFAYADPVGAIRSLTAVEFVDVSTTVVPLVWEVPDADAVVDALLQGTVRIGALLTRQPAGVLARVREAVGKELAGHEESGAVHIPRPAVVGRATEPDADSTEDPCGQGEARCKICRAR